MIQSYIEMYHHPFVGKIISEAPATMIKDDYLNWLCSLYQQVPDYARLFVLGILQWQARSGQHQELSRVVARISLNHPFNIEVMDPVEIESRLDQLRKLFRGLAEALPKSRWLSDKLIRHSISRQLHYYPSDNSVMVPEKMLSGGPAFLCQASAQQYKTAIFDLVSTCVRLHHDKIEQQIKQGIEPELVRALLAGEPESELPFKLEHLYYYWLATHHDSKSGSPVWVGDHYRKCFITTQPTLAGYYSVLRVSTTGRLPPQRLKEHLSQPDAEVVHGDDFLRLLDEFLGFIRA